MKKEPMMHLRQILETEMDPWLGGDVWDDDPWDEDIPLADDEDPDCDPDLLAAERWLAAHPLDDDEPADDGRYRGDLTH